MSTPPDDRHPIDASDAQVDEIVSRGPAGAFAVAGIATANAPAGPRLTISSTCAALASGTRSSCGVLTILAPYSGKSLRMSLTCRGVTGAPALPQATRM